MPSVAAAKYDDLDLRNQEIEFGRPKLRKSDDDLMSDGYPLTSGGSLVTGMTRHEAEQDKGVFWQLGSCARLREKLPDDPERHIEPYMFHDYLSFERGHVLLPKRHGTHRHSVVSNLDSITARVKERMFVDRVLVEFKGELHPPKRRVSIGDIKIYEAALQAMSGGIVEIVHSAPTVQSIIADIRTGGQEDIADRLDELRAGTDEDPDYNSINLASLEVAIEAFTFRRWIQRPAIVVERDGTVAAKWRDADKGLSILMAFLPDNTIWYKIKRNHERLIDTLPTDDALRFAKSILEEF